MGTPIGCTVSRGRTSSEHGRKDTAHIRCLIRAVSVAGAAGRFAEPSHASPCVVALGVRAGRHDTCSSRSASVADGSPISRNHQHATVSVDRGARVGRPSLLARRRVWPLDWPGRTFHTKGVATIRPPSLRHRLMRRMTDSTSEGVTNGSLPVRIARAKSR